ncbi:hypothetical protein [Levilactobacillus fujinensis]|uniref:Uncharacterized protein n=1 Tax=Levilactobacillus fujinensis TaxID=2486024 RepID=A0ABW1TI29_9LACO|nr:hypothetical protein [Levilactobacillus fujinensis]
MSKTLKMILAIIILGATASIVLGHRIVRSQAIEPSIVLVQQTS